MQDYESSDWAVSDIEDELVRLKDHDESAVNAVGKSSLTNDDVASSRRPSDIFNLLQLVQCNWSLIPLTFS